jgi:IclR family acetate operon transcriptional repressor
VAETATDGILQSVGRAFEVLEVLARAGGALSLSEIAAETGKPAPSVHRLVQTLVHLGSLSRESSRRYALAPALIRLGEGAARQFGTWGRPVLADLVEEVGESANMAILEGSQALYVAHVPGRHGMRMFTEVGRRVPLHATGVGKALLAQLPSEEAMRLVQLGGTKPATELTITDVGLLLEDLEVGRARGYAVDDGEQEIGVSCVAVPVPGAPALAAISFSGPAPRMTPDVVRRAAAALKDAARSMVERYDASVAAAD